jgi:hypothetical protein
MLQTMRIALTGKMSSAELHPRLGAAARLYAITAIMNTNRSADQTSPMADTPEYDPCTGDRWAIETSPSSSARYAGLPPGPTLHRRCRRHQLSPWRAAQFDCNVLIGERDRMIHNDHG